MMKLKMFSGSGYSNEDIIKSLKKQKEGELLPEEGHFNFMYDQLNGPCIPFMLSTKKEVVFCYIDHEEFILNIKDADPEWIVEVDQTIVKLIMMYNINESQLMISFNFDIAKEMFQDALMLLIKKKQFSLTYIALLYGGLVIDSRVTHKIPDKVIKALKEL